MKALHHIALHVTAHSLLKHYIAGCAPIAELQKKARLVETSNEGKVY